VAARKNVEGAKDKKAEAGPQDIENLATVIESKGEPTKIAVDLEDGTFFGVEFDGDAPSSAHPKPATIDSRNGIANHTGARIASAARRVLPYTPPHTPHDHIRRSNFLNGSVLSTPSRLRDRLSPSDRSLQPNT